MKEEQQKELQKKYMTMQIFKQQISALLEEKMALDNKINEVSMTIDAVKKMKEIKDSEEIWSSLGSGTYVRADIKDIDHVTINIGSNLFMHKDTEEAIKILERRLSELKEVDEEMVSEINKFGDYVVNLESELQKYVKDLEEEEK